MTSFFSDYQPQKTVRPTCYEEVQETIKKANRDRTPLVPVSSGTNLQDTHLPSVKDAIAVDLSRMNKITYLDARNRDAVIEPGVTFAQLEAACKAEGLRTLTAIDVPKEASVLGTYLEMMPLYGWPKYHPWEMLTMKGVRADGEVFATGQMAMSQDRPDKYSWGVSLAQVARLYCQAQGTLGIITNAAVTLKTIAPENQVFFFSCNNISRATKVLKAFIATEEPHEIFAVNKTYCSELLGQGDTKNLPPWTVVIVTRGFEKAEIAYKKKDLTALAKQLKGELATRLGSVKNAGAKILSEINNPTGFALHSEDGSGWAPLVTIATDSQIQKAAGLFPKDSGSLIMPLQAGGCFYYQPDLRYSLGEEKTVRKTYLTICEKLLKAGVTFPRPSALNAKQVVAHNPSYFKLLRSIKKGVDPNNIMNPKKLGL
jgi:FAD/FMN-containing dehydrogenase